MSDGRGKGLGQAPTNVLALGSGMMRAKGVPCLRICTVSPAPSHLETLAKLLRRSRTVAVLIVIRRYHIFEKRSRRFPEQLCVRHFQSEFGRGLGDIFVSAAGKI